MTLLNNLSQRQLFLLPNDLAASTWRRLSIRIRLCLVVAIILTPAMVLLGMITLRSISEERLHSEESLRRTAHQIGVEIEREVEVTSVLLNVLATSKYLQLGDLEKFYDKALRISRQLDVHIVVRRPQYDNKTITTAESWDEAPEFVLPAPIAEAEQQALASDKMVFSDVFLSTITQRLVVAGVLPVKRNGINEYVIAIVTPVSKIAAILENAPPGEGRLVSIIDRSNTIVARSEKSELFAGTKGHSKFPDVLTGTEGTFELPSREGHLLHSVYLRLTSTGWVILVGERKDLSDAAARNKIVYSAAAGTTLFAFAIGLTYLLGGRIEQRVGTLGIDRNPTREEFALLFDSAPNGVVLVDDKGRMLFTNVQFDRMFGYSQKETIGKFVETLIPNEMGLADLVYRQNFVSNPASHPTVAGRQLLGRHKDGREIPIEVGLHPITLHREQYTMATVIDITERNLAARALSSALAERDRLRRDLMRASDNERLRLSHELHDQTGQTLAAATLAAKDVERFLDADGRQRLMELSALLDQMGKTLHRVAWELRPTSIDELGLRAMLDNYISEWSDQTGMGTDFYCEAEDVDGLPDDVRTTIYRVIQESLTNVVKHAPETNWVSVVISQAGAVLQLTIENSGYGFDPADAFGKPNQHGSLGIAGMRERLSLIGGTLEIESSEGNGTTVFARIPIEPSEPA